MPFVKGHNINIGHKKTEEHKRKIGLANSVALKRFYKNGGRVWNRGVKNCYSKEILERMSKSHIGNRQSKEIREKIGKSERGELHWNWKGGISEENNIIRTSTKYKEWRWHVFQRDNYTCQGCGQRGGKLQIDHELPFSLFPDLRFEILNGRVFCKDCHIKYGWNYFKEMNPHINYAT